MADLSPARLSVPLLPELGSPNRGKVRDTYELGDSYLLLVVTDAISIYDFVLNALIPQKGYVLNALSHYWFKFLETADIPTHMVAVGGAIDGYLPMPLRGNPELWRKAMVVRKLDMLRDRDTGHAIEWIQRFCLTGNALSEYRKHGTVGGKPMPPGLQDGDELPEPVFDPTTKAPKGHDQQLNANRVREQYPDVAVLFQHALEKIARSLLMVDIRCADMKGELGKGRGRTVYFADEIGTPDCSRFWLEPEWCASRTLKTRVAPQARDKQLVREWGKRHKIHTLDPDNAEHVARVQALQIPESIVTETQGAYESIAARILNMPLEKYWRTHMGIPW